MNCHVADQRQLGAIAEAPARMFAMYAVITRRASMILREISFETAGLTLGLVDEAIGNGVLPYRF